MASTFHPHSLGVEARGGGGGKDGAGIVEEGGDETAPGSASPGPLLAVETLPSLGATPEQQAGLTTRLTQHVEAQQAIIQSLCSRNYGHFLENVEEVLRLRIATASLRSSVQRLGARLASEARGVAQASERALMHMTTLRRIRVTREAVQACQRVARLWHTSQHLLAKGRYHACVHALQQMEDLLAPNRPMYALQGMGDSNGAGTSPGQHTLPPPFFAQVRAKLPHMRANVRNAREMAPVVGRTAMVIADMVDESSQKRKAWLNSSLHDEGDGDGLPSVASHSWLSSPQGRASHSRHDRDNFLPIVSSSPCKVSLDDDALASAGFSLVQLHQCIHVHAHLSCMPLFISMYTEARRRQAHMVVRPEVDMSGSAATALSALVTFLYNITGFFVIESRVIQETSGCLLPMREMHTLWRMALVKAGTLVVSFVDHFADLPALHALHACLGVFITTLSSYGLPGAAAALGDAFLALMEAYSRAAVGSTANGLTRLLLEDSFEPLVLQSSSEWHDMIQCNALHLLPPFRDAGASGVKEHPAMATALPYTAAVPSCCGIVRDFVLALHAFCTAVRVDPTVLDAAPSAIVSRSLDHLLTSWSTTVLSLLTQSLPALPQLAQILLNLRTLHHLLGHWDHQAHLLLHPAQSLASLSGGGSAGSSDGSAVGRDRLGGSNSGTGNGDGALLGASGVPPTWSNSAAATMLGHGGGGAAAADATMGALERPCFGVITAGAAFGRAVDEVRSLLLAQLRRKVLSSCNPGSWLPAKAPSTASDSVQDMTLFLDTTLASLPEAAAELRATFVAVVLRTTATAFLTALRGNEVRTFNRAAVQAVSLDMRHVRRWADGHGADAPGALECTLMQLTDLLLSDDLSTFTQASLRRERYADLAIWPHLSHVLPKLKASGSGFLRVRKVRGLDALLAYLSSQSPASSDA